MLRPRGEFGRYNFPDGCGRCVSEGTDEEGRSVKGKELWPGLAIPPQFWKRRHTGRFS